MWKLTTGRRHGKQGLTTAEGCSGTKSVVSRCHARARSRLFAAVGYVNGLRPFQAQGSKQTTGTAPQECCNRRKATRGAPSLAIVISHSGSVERPFALFTAFLRKLVSACDSAQIERWLLFPSNLIGHNSSCRGPFSGPRGPFRTLPRHLFSTGCFRKSSAAHVFTRCVSVSIGAERKVCLSTSAYVGAACVGLGSIGLPVLHGHLAADTGPPFRGASANLPQTFHEVHRLLWFSAVSACFPRPRAETVHIKPQSFRKPSAREIPSKKPSACFRIFKNNVPLRTTFACMQKHLPGSYQLPRPIQEPADLLQVVLFARSVSRKARPSPHQTKHFYRSRRPQAQASN